jgi:hypothetical protein
MTRFLKHSFEERLNRPGPRGTVKSAVFVDPRSFLCLVAPRIHEVVGAHSSYTTSHTTLVTNTIML